MAEVYSVPSGIKKRAYRCCFMPLVFEAFRCNGYRCHRGEIYGLASVECFDDDNVISVGKFMRRTQYGGDYFSVDGCGDSLWFYFFGVKSILQRGAVREGYVYLVDFYGHGC